MEKEIKDNIPSKDFSDAIGKGIITREPIFELNGVKYHTFEKDLSMICANRYLLYQQDLQAYKSFGMSMDVSKDYVAEMIEHQEGIEKAILADDMDMVKKKYDDLKLTTLVYKEHQTNFNVISAILEFNAISFIAPCENPFVVDYDYYNKKIQAWGQALASGEGSEFLSFFLEAFLSWRPKLDAVISAVYEASGQESRGNDSGGVKEETVGRKYSSPRDFEVKKAFGRFTCGQEFIKSCKTITDYIKLSQAEIEQASILEYIQYSILVSDIVKKENENIEKMNKKYKND